MATLLTTAGHKRINLPHSPTIVDFVNGRAEVSEEVAVEVLEHFNTSVVRVDDPKPAAKPAPKTKKTAK